MKKSKKELKKEVDTLVEGMSNVVALSYPPQSVKFTNTTVINEALSPLVSRLLSEYSEILKHSPNINVTKATLDELIQKASDIRNSFGLLDLSLEDHSSSKSTLTFTSSRGANLVEMESK